MNSRWFLCLDFNKPYYKECSKRSLNTTITIFTDASWCYRSYHSGLGFIIIANLSSILVADFMGAMYDIPIIVEFVVCQSSPSNLHITTKFINLKHNMSNFSNLHIKHISWEDNDIAIKALTEPPSTIKALTD